MRLMMKIMMKIEMTTEHAIRSRISAVERKKVARSWRLTAR